MNTTTLYTMTWNKYWDKYGEVWSGYIEALHTKPDQIYVISDEPIPSCPYEVIVAPKHSDYPLNHYRQIAVDNCETEWLISADMDDTILPNYLDGLDNDYDIVAATIVEMPENKLIPASSKKQKFENLLDGKQNDHQVLYSGSAYKTKLLKQLGYTTVGMEDTIMNLRLRQLNPKVKWDDNVKYKYNTNNSVMLPMSLKNSKIMSEHNELVAKILINKDISNYLIT